MNDRQRVLIVFPTSWDDKQLGACRAEWEGRYEVELAEPTHEDCPWEFDVLAFIEATARSVRGRFRGVFSSSDYPGATAAAAIATRAGLPGSRPDDVIRCSHKHASRLTQREAVPGSTPGFELLDARRPELGLRELSYPCFVKPVKGAFSVLARRIDGPGDLEAFLRSGAVREFTTVHMQMFNRLVGALTDLSAGGHHFIAEELLEGPQATVEGFASGGRVEILGVVDSVVDPATGSFARFDYPSALETSIRKTMEETARRVIARAGLDQTMFNIEMVHDRRSGAVRIIEINPRLCGQYADLYQKVDGTNGYEVALALATGRRPRIRRGRGAYPFASSFPMRVFEKVRVAAVPDDETIGEVEADLPHTLIWRECSAGQELADFETLEDGRSFRYGVVNLGAGSRSGILEKFEAIRERLGYRFEPL